MPDECVAVFTARSPHRILREGGSQAWALDANRARKATYLVCVQNQHHEDRNFSDASEPHGAAYLVGKITDVVPTLENPDSGRWKICIEEYSTVQVPNAWKGWRNPVRYTTFKELGIKLEQLAFHSIEDMANTLPLPTEANASSRASSLKAMLNDDSVVPLSMAAAKPALAAFYGVTPDAIEIVIRG